MSREPLTRRVRIPRTLAKAMEIKHIDTAPIIYTGLSNAWQVWAIGPLVQQGTDYMERIGRKIKVLHLSLKLRFTPVIGTSVVAGVLGQPEQFRVVVWLDKETKGTLPLSTQIYETATRESFPNAVWTKRFVQLGESYMAIVPTQMDATNQWALAAQCIQNMNFEIPFGHGLEVNFSNTTAAFTNIVDNGLVITICGSRPTPQCNVSCQSRISYIDV
jgi:hypothetical protein